MYLKFTIIKYQISNGPPIIFATVKVYEIPRSDRPATQVGLDILGSGQLIRRHPCKDAITCQNRIGIETMPAKWPCIVAVPYRF